MLRRVLHPTKEWDHAMKEYNALKRRKRQMYKLTKEEQDVYQLKHDPKNAWQQMKGRKRDIVGDFSSKDMCDYVKNLYSPIEAQTMTNATIQVNSKELITF